MTEERGFTLLEILIATALSIIVAMGIYTVYTSQARSRQLQETILEMQQNLRAAMFLMGREIRMAGYNGNVAGSGGGAGILVATATAFGFTYVADTDGMDNDGDGEVDESSEISRVQYALYDGDGDGDTDDIGRIVDGGVIFPISPVAQNIENMEFLYVLNDGAATYAPVDPADVRSVRLTILARSARADADFTDTGTYVRPAPTGGDPPPVWGPFNDGFHRNMMTGRFFLRNM